LLRKQLASFSHKKSKLRSKNHTSYANLNIIISMNFQQLFLVLLLASVSQQAQGSLRGHLQESFGTVQAAAFSMEERIVHGMQHMNLRLQQQHPAQPSTIITATDLLSREQDSACYDCCCDRDVICGARGKSQATCRVQNACGNGGDAESVCASKDYQCPEYDCDMANDLW
jgi:hypothetical protein